MCKEDSPPKIQVLSTNIETNNSDSDEKNTSKPNVDGKVEEKIKKKLKKSDKKPSKQLEESIEEQSSPIKEKDESSKCYEKISETKYNPTKKDYHPIKDAFWDHDQP